VDDSETIDYKITLPSKKLFHDIESENHDYVNFNATEKGLYTFILINNRAKDTIKVTFAVHAGLNMDGYFNKKHFSTIRGEFIKAKHLSRQLEGTKKVWNMKFSKHLDKANSHNRSILIFSLVESAVLILIFYFQLKYVLNLVEKI
jgi:hypothetical protein